MELTIPNDHAEVLREVLNSALRDLRFEIADTDRADYKHMLKERETVLRALLAPLGGPLPDPPLR
jgi:hypothetical protein